jgi:TolB-like protein/Tfp pilus assembly protein PilF
MAGAWWAVGAVRRATGHATIRRLAVLQPASFTGDTTQDYFVQGVQEALITNLQEAGLTVLGRTSVQQYRKTEKTPRQISRELGVDALIEASVMRSSDSMEISVRLIDGRTEVVRWEHTYPGEVRSIFTLYHGVTRAIAEQVHSALSPAAAARLATARTVDPQAYDDYLRGWLLWQRLTPSDLDAALESFHRALRRDSTYAPAWAGIASVWMGRAQMWLITPRVAIAQQRVAMQRALELDSNSVAVLDAKYGLAWDEWDLAGGERALRRAIAINPNYPDVRVGYANLLFVLGHFREARAQIERAIELEPLNAFFRAIYALELICERRYADAVREARRALQITPDQPAAMFQMWDALQLLGRYDEALAMLRKIYAGDQGAQDAITRGFAEGGFRAALRRLAMYQGAHVPSPYVGWEGVAGLYALAGEKDSAFAWLERAYQARDPNMLYLDEPDLDAVRDDPRFRDMCRRVGLPTCSR